jgi:hypothetical protein
LFGAVVADLNAVALLVGSPAEAPVWRYGLTIGTIGIYSNHGRRSFKQVVGRVRTQRTVSDEDAALNKNSRVA